ncbi:hypothetical protein RYX36_002689 [Vicia faba]
MVLEGGLRFIIIDALLNVVAIECLASDQEALLDFKNGLQYSHNCLSSWRSTNCCQWQGIRCDNVTGAVVAVDLHNPSHVEFWNISGELRPSLMKLKSLSHLDLSFNTFSGIPIPKFLGSLMHLQYLNLSKAGFAGLIPPHLGNLSHLQSLGLADYSLHVENLEWVVGLVSLKHFRMDGVDLSSVATTDWYLNLGNNENLKASCSQLLMKGWERIQVLDLSINKLHGILPSSIGNLTYLTYLDLHDNAIEGGIPSSIGQLCNLNIIDLSRNKMTGTLPEFLLGIQNCPSRKPLPNLVYFIMSYN